MALSMQISKVDLLDTYTSDYREVISKKLQVPMERIVVMAIQEHAGSSHVTVFYDIQEAISTEITLAISDLQAHHLPHMFSHRQCYFLGKKAGYEKLKADYDEDMKTHRQLGMREMARMLYDEVICPMCYRLNPQHAPHEGYAGCKSCQDKEERCGEKE